MDPTLREYYQWIQVLAYYLQAETWPFTDKEISQQDAKTQIVIAAQSLGLDPTDKDIFIKIINKIDELLTGREAILDTSQLDVVKIRELVEEYDKHLVAVHERKVKSIYVSLDKETIALQKSYAEQLKAQLVGIEDVKEKFENNPRLADVVSEDIGAIATELPRVAREAALTEVDYRQVLTQAQPKISQTLEQVGARNPEKITKTFVKQVVEKTLPIAQEVSVTPRKLVPSEEIPKEPPLISLEETKVIEAKEALEREVGFGLSRVGLTFYSPSERKELSRAAKEIITAHLLELPREDIPQAKYEQLLKKTWPRIREKLEKKGLSVSETQVESFIKDFVKKTQREAVILTTLASRPLPKEIADRLAAEEEGVALWPAYPLAQPGLVLAYLRRLILGPGKKVLEIAASEATPEWQEMIDKGLFAEDLEESVAELIKAGVQPDHPAIKQLEEKKQRIGEQQKVKVADEVPLKARELERIISELRKAGVPQAQPVIRSLEGLLLEARKVKRVFLQAEEWKAITTELRKIGLAPTPTLRKLERRIWKNVPAVEILQEHYKISKLRGQYQIFEPETGIYLPRTYPVPIKGRLQEFLNKLGLATKLYQRVKLGPGKTVIRPYLSERWMRFITRHRFSSFSHLLEVVYRKTLGRLWLTFTQAFAKTAIGKAIKEGIKKVATWLATRAGVQTAVAAAGVAGAGPTAGVSLLIAAAVNLALEVGGKILGKIWDKIKSVFREPEKALALIGVGTIAAVVLPMPIALVAIAPIAIGTLGLASWGVASAGTILGGFATQVTTFFVVLATAPITAPIALLVVLIIGILATTTFFIVMTTAGAFVLPIGPVAMVEEYPPPEEPPIIPPPPGLVFSWPTSPGTGCTSNFGYRPNPFANCCEYHEGIDIGAACDAPVYATADGVVTDVGYNSSYGVYIVIKHADNLYSIYAHLDDDRGVNVSKGQEVKKSDLIGWVGHTGQGTGCHLHFGFSECGTVPSCFNNGAYTPDPCDYIPCPSGCSYRDEEEGCQGLPLCGTQ